ncbi:MAG: isochorismatase family protein [Nanoarchaeota archaeon]|nr:isochorismatase family protein [Nanoarchaeota archaeon]
MKKLENKLEGLGIVVVDMQEEFRKEMQPYETLLNSHKKIISFGIENEIPIYFLELKAPYRDLGETIEELKSAVKNYPKKQFIKKNYSNGFNESPLEGELINYSIENLIVSGVNKNDCVRATVESAIRKGYKIFTSKDLMNEPEFGNNFYQKKCEKYFENSIELINYFSS